jgi:hypothetical protein
MPRTFAEEQEHEAYLSYVNLAAQRRGVILNECTLLEGFMDWGIASYFCSEQKKQEELRELIISTNRMIFENKVQVAKFLIEKYKKHTLASHPSVFTDILNKIIPQRNIFAHYWLDINHHNFIKWAADKKTVFIKYKNTTESIEYDDKKVAEILELIKKCTITIVETQAIVSPRHGKK